TYMPVWASTRLAANATPARAARSFPRSCTRQRSATRNIGECVFDAPYAFCKAVSGKLHVDFVGVVRFTHEIPKRIFERTTAGGPEGPRRVTQTSAGGAEGPRRVTQTSAGEAEGPRRVTQTSAGEAEGPRRVTQTSAGGAEGPRR